MMLWSRLLAATGAIAATTLAGSAAQAAGFYIQEQSVTGLGRAFAGQVAIGDDVSALSFNPATITQLPSAEISVGGTLIVPHADPANDGSNFGGAPFPGGDGGNPYDPTLVPAFQAAYPLLDDRLWIGFAVTAPFGLGNEYEDGWIGRYDSTTTDLTTINLQPSIAYEVTPWLSIGGGLDIQYADAELRQAVPVPPGGPFTPAADGELKIEGDDWSVGFNLGVVVTPREDTRVGLHYRSGIDHELTGEASLRTALGTVIGQSGGTADLDLPDIVSFGVAHDLTDRWTVAGSVNWYNWSSFETIRVDLDGNVLGQTVLEDRQEYEDSFGFAVGAEYEVSDAWTLRGGFQFDETPTQDGFRSTRVPDGDRYWVTLGASYRFNERFSVDAGYAHIFVSEGAVDQDSELLDGLRTKVDYDNGIDLLALGLRYRF